MDEKKILTPSGAPKFDTGTQTTSVAFGALPLFRLAATLLPPCASSGRPRPPGGVV